MGKSKEEILQGTISPTCHCHEIYKSRKKVDPSCEHCNYWDFVLEDMELYANEQSREVAIGFAEWMDNKTTRNDMTGLWVHNLKQPNTPITTKELFDLYIQSKTNG